MIKAQDLRIGDLVRVSHNCSIPKGTVCVVTEIYPERTSGDKKGIVRLSYTDDTDDRPWGVWCCNVEGIPLTPEFLSKNGFKEEFVGKYYTIPIKSRTGDSLVRYLAVERKKYTWALFIRYYNVIDNALLRHIKYVHELQHILWALGEDANLKI